MFVINQDGAELRGEHGRVRVAFQLSPRPEARIQKYDATSVLPASPALVEAATRLAELAAAPDPVALAALLEAGADVNDPARKLEAARALFGRFRVGATEAGAGVDGDGAERATLRWHGERGEIDVTLVLRAGRVRLEHLKPRPVPDA